LEIWKVATTVTLEHPIVGVGFGAYPSAHFDYSQRAEFDPTAWGHRDAHSTYLRLAAELGWIGLFIFCAMVFATVHDAERSRRLARHTHPRLAKQLLYMELGLGAYLVAGIWASWGALVFTYIHLALINVAANLLAAEAGPPHRIPRSKNPVRTASRAPATYGSR
jgi:O-antigen ligase